MQIIYDINLFFLQRVESHFSGDRSILSSLSIIEEAADQQVRMAHLAVVGSHTVNGVAAIHSSLIYHVVRSRFHSRNGGVVSGVLRTSWLVAK